MPYGLTAMTGVIPTVFVAGVAMKMAERLFPPQPQPARRRRTTRRRASTTSRGNFSNLGF